MAQVVVSRQGALSGNVVLEDFALFINKVCGLTTEKGHCQPLKLLETDVADRSQNHLVGAVVVRHEVKNVLTLVAFHQLRGSQYVA